jgi:TonB-linked SusC/RagA family outer membrane protein
MRKIVLLFFAVLVAGSLLAQNRTVTGTVTDASGEAVVGATVIVEGTTIGVAAGVDGSFSISAPATATLTISSIGYETQKVPISGRSHIDVTLQQDAQTIEEVLVLGYGSGQNIGNIVGSVSTISAGEIAERPSANIADALQGKVAGLQVFNTSGEPSGTSSMRLRGTSSFYLSNAPLYILDGVPVSSGVFNSISPQDIENISILKDASSTAIYGSRAANGVIYISTKKGRRGEKPSVSLRAQYGVSMLTNYKLDMMNSKELIQFEEMVTTSLATDPAFQARKAFILGNNIDFDWTDYLYNKSAPVVQADASVRGATENTNYYVSMGFYSEDGTSKVNSGMDRFTFRTNLDTQILKWLKFGANIGLTYQKYSTVTTGWYTQSPILQAVTGVPYRTPYEILYNEDGTISYGDVYDQYPYDGMIDLNEYYKKNTNLREEVNLMGQTYFQLTPVKGLTIRAAQAIDAFDYTNESVNKPSFTPYSGRGRNSQAFQRYYQLSSTNTAEYKYNIDNKHFFTGLVGHESTLTHQRTFNATGAGLTDDRLTAFASTTEILSWGGNHIEKAANSFFANFNYNYDGKYFVDASVRSDGSSLFGANYRYATFYSIGGMWKAKRESFLEDVSWLDDLNVNLSYGTTGNSGFSSDQWYESLGLVGTGPKYNGNAGWGLAQVPNADLTWETVSLLNLTLSGRVLDRIDFDLQFYNKVSDDLLMELPYSGTTGHSGGMGNIASMFNRGVELAVTVDLIHTENIYWSVSANVNYNKNQITKLFHGLNYLDMPNTGLRYQVGKSSSAIFDVVRAGVDPADGSPMWYDRNGNLTKTFSEDNMQFWGTRYDNDAPWSGGFSTAFSWKGLGLNADFSWIGERWLWLNERYYTRTPAGVIGTSNFERVMLNMWTTPGQVTDIPKASTPFNMDTAIYSNAAFLRMKNLSLSYNFSDKIMQKIGFLQSMKVYVTGRNLLTITGYEGYDPEVGYGNGTQGLYPNSRQIVFGAEIVF